MAPPVGAPETYTYGNNLLSFRIVRDWNAVKNSVLEGVEQFLHQKEQEKQATYLYLERQTPKEDGCK
jgi:hypothetical protein